MTRRSLLLLLLIGILMASCAPSNGGQPTPDINGTIAANAQTLVAALFQTQTALAPVATNTAIPTVTPLPTATALALGQTVPTVVIQQPVFVVPTATGPTSTPLASSLASGCNNLRLINGYTVPDSPLIPGQDFTQYWKVENNGTCDWLYLYSLEYASGQKLSEGTSYRFGNKIPPGKWTTLSVNLHAPNNSGKYKASWRFTDGAGKSFGDVLLVSITVGGSTNTPKPDTAATTAAQQTIDAAVQQTAVQAQIYTAVAASQTASAVAATNVAATSTKQALCLSSPPSPPNPPCP